MSATITIKRGETLSYSATLADDDGVAVNLTGYTLASSIRQARDTSATPTTVTVTKDPDQTTNPGVFTLVVAAATTDAWTPGVRLAMDVKVTAPASTVAKTDTIFLDVVEDMTR